MKRKTWVLAASAVLVALIVTGGVVTMSGGKDVTPAAQEPPPNTANVEEGKLSAMVSQHGTLVYRARSDGSPYSVINQARGIYTWLPEAGDKVDCGGVFYRVDDDPVLLLCGTVPSNRDLGRGDEGADVRQLNGNLHTLGYDADAGVDIDPDGNAFTSKTQQALEELQRGTGLGVTGELDLDDAVVLPDSVRIGKVTAQLGGSAQPGADIAYATSDTLDGAVPWRRARCAAMVAAPASKP